MVKMGVSSANSSAIVSSGARKTDDDKMMKVYEVGTSSSNIGARAVDRAARSNVKSFWELWRLADVP
jgi:hypothetical protein